MTYFLLLEEHGDGSGGSDMAIPPGLWEPYRKMLEAQAEAYADGKRKTAPRAVEAERERIETQAQEVVRDVIREVPVFPDLSGVNSAISALMTHMGALEERLADSEATLARGREKELTMRQAAEADSQRRIIQQQLDELRRQREQMEDEELLLLII